MTATIVLVLLLVALVLAGIALIRSRVEDLVAWAVLLLAVALVIERVA